MEAPDIVVVQVSSEVLLVVVIYYLNGIGVSTGQWRGEGTVESETPPRSCRHAIRGQSPVLYVIQTST